MTEEQFKKWMEEFERRYNQEIGYRKGYLDGLEDAKKRN